MHEKRKKIRPVYNNIRTTRKAKGFNQSELASCLGVSRQQISEIENGYVPNLATAFGLAIILNVPLEKLFWVDQGKLSKNLEFYYGKYSAIYFVHKITKEKESYLVMAKLIKENPELILDYDMIVQVNDNNNDNNKNQLNIKNVK